MHFVTTFIDLVLHSDTVLREWVLAYGAWIYAVLFAIVFMETALVVTPFLPGDSLIFTGGALAAVAAGGLDVWSVATVLIVAAVLGDAINYSIGRRWGRRLLDSGRFSRVVTPRHISRTEAFFARHGGKTISLARFVPFVRTFAPFVAGVSRMERLRFTIFNVAGAVAWVSAFVAAGYFFGTIPFVARNLELLVVGIVVVSLAPALWPLFRERLSHGRG